MSHHILLVLLIESACRHVSFGFAASSNQTQSHAGDAHVQLFRRDATLAPNEDRKHRRLTRNSWPHVSRAGAFVQQSMHSHDHSVSDVMEHSHLQQDYQVNSVNTKVRSRSKARSQACFSTEWRVKITSVAGGGSQVQTTECSFVDSDKKLFASATAWAGSQVTAGNCENPRTTCSGNCATKPEIPKCQANLDGTGGDQTNMDPLPQYWTYTFSDGVTPQFLALSDSDSKNRNQQASRYPTTLIPEFKDEGGNWQSCSEIKPTVADSNDLAFLAIDCSTANGCQTTTTTTTPDPNSKGASSESGGQGAGPSIVGCVAITQYWLLSLFTL